ncbi:hypothetical protein [Acidovorax sp.]|uniref:hypothetical protein n=1 Tax=Acidovorax sp. TaxID=1872122 RepID=UPI0040380A0E
MSTPFSSVQTQQTRLSRRACLVAAAAGMAAPWVRAEIQIHQALARTVGVVPE